MKFLNVLLITLFATTLFWGCSDDDDSTAGVNSSISLSTGIVQVDKKGGEVSVTVTSSGYWRLAGVCDWAHPSVTSGKNGDVVTFTIDSNEENVYRCCTFKFFVGAQVAPLKIESYPGYVMQLLSEESLSFSRDKDILTIKLNTNIEDPTIAFSDGGEEWITFIKRAEFGEKVSLQFEVAANETYKNRSSRITLSSPLVDNEVIVDVLQKQTDAIITDQQSIVHDLSARTISFEVKYNVENEISVIKGDDWITNQQISEPTVSDDGLSTVTVSYQLGEATVTRGGVIYIKQKDGPVYCEISVIQKDSDAEIVEIPDENLRTAIINNGWAISVGGNNCIVVEECLKATSFENDYYNKIENLKGIEAFPNLEKLALGNVSNMVKLDISGLHKVKTLTFFTNRYVAEYDLGDNPVENFSLGTSYLYVSDIKIVSSVIESFNLMLSGWYAEYDNVESIDVSECSALKTLDVRRGSKLKTLYLKTGQDIPNLTKNEFTQIVYK